MYIIKKLKFILVIYLVTYVFQSVAAGGLFCNCSAEYQSISGTTKDSLQEQCTDIVGKWDEAEQVGPMVDDCNEDDTKCKCMRVYQITVAIKNRINVNSGSAQSKEQLKAAMIEADETCEIVSKGQDKTYHNNRCVYYSGFNDEPGQENVQHDSCIVVREGDETNDKESGESICYI